MRTHRLTLVFFVVLLLSACRLPGVGNPAAIQSPSPPGELRRVTILYTDDEHGWMKGQEAGQGADNLMGLWREREGYGGEGAFLILSGGDNWTGPAISTWFDGQGMVEVMNAMDYAASALGNHEFDFGLEAMQTRFQEAAYPYLSANTRYKSDHSVPTVLGIQPYTILDVAGVKFGIIGLTTTSTPQTTNPVNVSAFEFIDYEQALREFAPQVKAAGAQVILVSAHVCPDELVVLAQKVKDLDIPFMGGGHCHGQWSEKIGDTVIASSGANFSGYVSVNLEIDTATSQTTIAGYGVQRNQGGASDETIAEIIARWQALADAELNKEIGYLENEIPRQSRSMQALITETWLIGYPNADVALTNLGGMRDRFPVGALTVAEIVGVMPFNNVLVDVQLSGARLIQILNTRGHMLAVGGVRREAGKWILTKSGAEIDKEQSYSVLVNDFMYAGGDGFDMLAQYDPNAYDTAIDWRQPLIDWVLAQESSPAKPLDPAIAALGR